MYNVHIVIIVKKSRSICIKNCIYKSAMFLKNYSYYLTSKGCFVKNVLTVMIFLNSEI